MGIASLFTLVGLGLSTQALAAPTLTVSGSCGGVTTAVTDATNYRLVYGEVSAYTIPGGSCADTEIGVTGSVSAPMSDSETTFVLNELNCGASAQVIDMNTCEVSPVVVLPTEDAYDMGYDDGYAFGYDEGVASVDTTSYYDEGYTAGYAAAPTPESNDESICTAAGGTWDGSDCTAPAPEEPMNCWQSGFCQGLDDTWGTGRPRFIVGHASEVQCEAADSSDVYSSGVWTASSSFSYEYNALLVAIHMCET